MPSPLVFKIFGEGQPQEVKGYCAKRKDSLAMFKDENGKWQVVHKATGNTVTSAISSSYNSYPKLIDLMSTIQERAGESLQILDRMDLGERVTSPEQVNAAKELRRIIQEA